MPHVKVQAIMAIERNPPKSIKPIKWLIITNLEIENVEQAIEKVKWYSYRWNIEIYQPYYLHKNEMYINEPCGPLNYKSIAWDDFVYSEAA